MSKILVIGNGFDKNVGLNTTYSDFIDSDEFKKISGNDPGSPAGLSKYLVNVHGLQNWVDVEHELKKFVLGLKANLSGNARNVHNELIPEFVRKLTTQHASFYKDNLLNNYYAIKRALHQYLSRIFDSWSKSPISNNSAGAALLLHGALTPSLSKYGFSQEELFDKIYSLNYTNTPSYFLRNNHAKLINLHGSLDKNNMVFGVEDSADLGDDFQFLYKSDHDAFGDGESLATGVKDANEIHFFGISFGDTDDAHFKPAIAEMIRNPHETRIFIYVWGTTKEAKKSSYYQLTSRLRNLTDYKYDYFKQKVKVFYIDAEAQVKIDQTWIDFVNN